MNAELICMARRNMLNSNCCNAFFDLKKRIVFFKPKNDVKILCAFHKWAFVALRCDFIVTYIVLNRSYGRMKILKFICSFYYKNILIKKECLLIGN